MILFCLQSSFSHTKGTSVRTLQLVAGKSQIPLIVSKVPHDDVFVFFLNLEIFEEN